MTKAIIACLAILVLSLAAAEASSPSPVASMPPMSEVESGGSTPPGAIPESRKLMGRSGGGEQVVGGAEMLLRGCVPKELCSKNERLCFRVCTAGVEEHNREECSFKCVKCTPTC